jgi:Zn-dependent M16 (insulinase) family peptidase
MSDLTKEQQAKLKVGDQVAGFTLDTIQEVSELNSSVYIFSHNETGARALHIYNDDRNNLFSTAFRTPVSDNTGVPHILEHSVLAGSTKYPLKDPFKELLKSSMQTFLNAITYPDRTLYPVSSQVETDFFNLVDVYCDAIFNPLLTKHTFSQEGWHYDVEDSEKPVSIKGIVYNEMKGVFSDFQSHAARKMLSGLMPDTTYFFESGGEPEHIPELTYEEFKEFHAKYYHPSNSFIVLYGDIPSEKTLGYIQDNFLKEFDRREVDSEVSAQPLWSEPQTMTIEAPAPKENDGTATVLLNWIWDGVTDGKTGLINDILTRYLFSGESAPLKRALLDSGLGEDLDDMCGYDNDLVNGTFSAGLNKTKPEEADKIRDIILDTIKKEIDNGFDDELLEGAIRRIEFKLREIRKGGHFPYPLRLAEGVYRSWLYGGDPLTHIAFEDNLAAVKELKKAGNSFFENKLKELTIDNPHRLTMVVKASSKMGEELGKQTEVQSAKLSKDFSAEQKAEYQKLTENLLAEQKKEHTEEELSCLPVLDKSDIPLLNEVTPCEIGEVAGRKLFTQPLFTAGITYFDIGFNLQTLPQDLLVFYPLYAEYITRAGAGGLSAGDMAKKVNLVTGGIHCSDFITQRFDNSDKIVSYTTFHGKSLTANSSDMVSILQDIINVPDFTNNQLLKNIILESRNDLHTSIGRSGHSYAVLSSSSRLLVSKSIEENLDGISQYRFLKGINVDDTESIFEKFKLIHSLLINRESAVVSLTTKDHKKIVPLAEDLINSLPAAPLKLKDFNSAVTLSKKDKPFAVEISSSVNYVTQSWKIDGYDSNSMGEHYLMSRLLSTGFLWDKVRVEGGAYGGMAIVGSSHPLFSFASYRDPNLTKTIDNYELALKYIATSLTQNEVDKGITGAVGKLDIPKSPHTLGYGETMARLSGTTVESRQEIRSSILGATATALKQRAESLLDTIDSSVVTALASADSLDKAEKDGFDMEREKL